MTLFLNDSTIWKSYFMIKYMWIFMLIKYVLLLDVWSLYNTRKYARALHRKIKYFVTKTTTYE
jgi:hypothetical protein